jgi:CheY-like chemotaxis protein
MLTVERARVPLNALLRSVVEELAPQAEAKGLRLVAVRTRLAVDSDPALLGRIVRNLVANAVRYTRAGGVIVGARRRGERVFIEVVDSGIGIAPEHRERIFEEFFQVRAHGGTTNASRGMGLGLAIVRRFAGLLGHELRLDSRPGRGSRFTVVAPRVTDLRAPLPHESHAGEARSDPAAGSLAGATVAVIDDDPAAIEGMRALLSTWGAEVAGGRDAGDALASLGRLERYPDLIVADFRLDGGASGIEAIGTLRDELGVRIPALVVSGDTSLAAAQAVRAAGIALLPKPVIPGALAAAASALIASANAMRH